MHLTCKLAMYTITQMLTGYDFVLACMPAGHQSAVGQQCTCITHAKVDIFRVDSQTNVWKVAS